MNLKAMRIEKNMTQRQVADIAGISQSYYADIENGNKAIGDDLPVETAKGIAKALGIEWTAFFENQTTT